MSEYSMKSLSNKIDLDSDMYHLKNENFIKKD